MPVSGNLRLQQGETDETISFEIEDSDKAVLEAFLTYVEDLRRVPLLREGMPTSLQIKCGKDQRTEIKTEVPHKDHIAVLLHRFRPLILQEEHASYSRVSAVVSRVLPSTSVRKLLRAYREIYEGKRSQRVIRIASDEVLLNCEKTLMKYLNAYEYHRDQDKVAELERLHQVLPLESSMPIFLGLLIEKAHACFLISGLIELLLGRKQSLLVGP